MFFFWRKDNCIFCQICKKQAPATILYEDEEVVVFQDIKPAAKHHYLSIPKKHIDKVTSLKSVDTELVEKLITIGKQVLLEQGGDVNDVLMGFHWPPFNSVNHLHLHIISPASQMTLMGRQIFKSNSMWFATADYVLEHIRNKL